MRKEGRTYYFSVEGQTEKWYLDWLENVINATPEARFRVKLASQIETDPLTRAKGLAILGKTEITHVVDRESEDKIHTDRFQATLGRMKEAQGSGKSIKYLLGYSNFTFELWMILHKTSCNGALTHRSHYLDPLNRAYGEKFEDLRQYKQEDNFKRLLRKLSLKDVRRAIQRAETIMQLNKEAGYVPMQYKGYSYYRENPSLSIWQIIKRILSDCELLRTV